MKSYSLFPAALALALSLASAQDDLPHDWRQAVPHDDQDALLSKGLAEAETYREELLGTFKGSRKTRAQIIHQAVDLFVVESTTWLKERDRPVLSPDFRLSEETFVESIEGTPRLDETKTAFGIFRGKWWGLWDGNRVDHDWGPLVVCDPVVPLGNGGSRIKAIQYAWIGDGFGWNVLCHDRKKNNRAGYILGSVYHVKDGDRKKTTIHRPHVGLAIGGDKLIWLTRDAIFLEETFRGKKGDRRYMITGFYCHFEGNRLRSKGAFQSIYTKDPENRPPWLAMPAPNFERWAGRSIEAK
ncbi:MAG: hypothetical protein AAF514_09535 [Verrucomicrobiota bacterium]